MKSTLFVSTALLSLATAFPSDNPHPWIKRQYGGPPDDDPHKWVPARQIPGAVRSPCPWQNTAANHGFLPRDGKRISIARFNKAITESLGFDPDFANTITTGMLGKLGVLNNDSSDASLLINLDQTNAHDLTEHDASFTRHDASEGDASTVVPKLVDLVLADTIPKNYPYLNASSFGRTRARRDRESRALGNPPLTAAFEGAAIGEVALILLIMGPNTHITEANAEAYKAEKKRTATWLKEERFPYELGFAPKTPLVPAAEVAPLRESITKFQQFEQMFDGGNPPATGPYVKTLNIEGGWH